MKRSLFLAVIFLAIPARGEEPTPGNASKIPEGSLEVQFGDMAKPEIQPFESSFAFWSGDTILYLVFRNFDAPHKWRVDPPKDGAQLLVIIRRYNGALFEKVTTGNYNPGLLPESILNPIGCLVLTDKNNKDFVVGAYWTLNDGGKVVNSLWGKMKTIGELGKIGLVTIREVSPRTGEHVAGSIRLYYKGEGENARRAFGTFRLAVIDKPKDY